MSARARPRRRHGASREDPVDDAALAAVVGVLGRVDLAEDAPAISSPSKATTHRDGSWSRVAEEVPPVLLGRTPLRRAGRGRRRPRRPRRAGATASSVPIGRTTSPSGIGDVRDVVQGRADHLVAVAGPRPAASPRAARPRPLPRPSANACIVAGTVARSGRAAALAARRASHQPSIARPMPWRRSSGCEQADRHERAAAVGQVAPLDRGRSRRSAPSRSTTSMSWSGSRIDEVRVVARHPLGGDDLLDARRVAGRLVGRGHAREVGGAAEPAESEAGHGRAVRDLDLVGERDHQRSLPYFWSMCGRRPCGSGASACASAARARGSSLRSAKASSRSSLRMARQAVLAERPVVDGAPDGAAGLALVAAVAEAAAASRAR